MCVTILKQILTRTFACVHIYVHKHAYTSSWYTQVCSFTDTNCLLLMHSTSSLYIQATGHMVVDVQTDRQIQWMNKRNIAQTHTLAHVEHTRRPLSCGGDECELTFSRSSYILTYLQTYVCVFIDICFLFVHLIWVCMTAFPLSLCFSSVQLSLFERKPAVGSAIRHISRAFIAQVTLRVSHGC
jgi:hypothetical protein